MKNIVYGVLLILSGIGIISWVVRELDFFFVLLGMVIIIIGMIKLATDILK